MDIDEALGAYSRCLVDTRESEGSYSGFTFSTLAIAIHIRGLPAQKYKAQTISLRESPPQPPLAIECAHCYTLHTCAPLDGAASKNVKSSETNRRIHQLCNYGIRTVNAETHTNSPLFCRWEKSEITKSMGEMILYFSSVPFGCYLTEAVRGSI